MKVQLTEKEIEMVLPKGKHIKKLWNMMLDAQGAENESETVRAMMHYQEALVCELTGLDVDTLDEMPFDDKQKLIDVIMERAMKAVDFTLSSRK